MRLVFTDTYYWIAYLNDQDQGHAAALAISQSLQGATLVTTEEVFIEVLTYFSGRGRYLRQLAAATVHSVYANSKMQVLPQSQQSFLTGLALYEARPDKEYSLTDCISMNAMRTAGITEVLTDDDHFTQEGFTKLL